MPFIINSEHNLGVPKDRLEMSEVEKGMEVSTWVNQPTDKKEEKNNYHIDVPIYRVVEPLWFRSIKVNPFEEKIEKKKVKSTLITSSDIYSYSTTTLTPHYLEYREGSKEPIEVKCSEGFDGLYYDTFPFFYSNTWTVPKGVYRTISREVPKKMLKKVHPNYAIAKDLCMMFTTNLGYSDNMGAWRNLSSTILREQLHCHPKTYTNVRNCLEYNCKKGPIVECDYNGREGEHCYGYRLRMPYCEKGVATYDIKSTYAVQMNKKNTDRYIQRIVDNPICKNLLQFYSRLTLPTQKECV